MKTVAEMIEVMKEFEKGAKIEGRLNSEDAEWLPRDNPGWDWINFDYRVVKEPISFWVNVYPEKVIRGPFTSKEEADIHSSRDRIRCCKVVEKV